MSTRLVKFRSLPWDETVLVNPAAVTMVERREGQTWIHFGAGHAAIVSASVEVVQYELEHA